MPLDISNTHMLAMTPWAIGGIVVGGLVLLRHARVTTTRAEEAPPVGSFDGLRRALEDMEGGAADRRQERKNRKQQGLDDFGCVSGPLSLPPPKAKRPGYAG